MIHQQLPHTFLFSFLTSSSASSARKANWNRHQRDYKRPKVTGVEQEDCGSHARTSLAFLFSLLSSFCKDVTSEVFSSSCSWICRTSPLGSLLLDPCSCLWLLAGSAATQDMVQNSKNAMKDCRNSICVHRWQRGGRPSGAPCPSSNEQRENEKFQHFNKNSIKLIMW